MPIKCPSGNKGGTTVFVLSDEGFIFLEDFMINRQRRGTLCVLSGGILWGFSGCLGQFLFMNYGFDAEWLTSSKMLLAGAALSLCAFILNKKGFSDIVKNKKDITILIIYSVLGLMICQLAYLQTIRYSNAGTATVLEYLFPVFVILYACLTTPRKPKIKELIAIALAVSGTYILATHGRTDRLVLSVPTLIWGLLAAVSCFVYNVSPVGLIEKYGSIQVTGLGMLIGGAILFTASGSYGLMPIKDMPSLAAFILICLVGTVLAFTLYMQGVRDIGAVKSSMLVCIEPVAATVISALWLGTKFYTLDIIGFVLIISVIFITAKKESGGNYV